jgi:FeS assembly SUF system protein
MTPARTAWTPDGEVPVANNLAPGSPVATNPDPASSAAESAGLPSEDRLIEAIATVYDPEIPVNIYELGLIYAVEISDDGAVRVEMTLTAPACPSAQELPEQVQQAVLAVAGVTSCHVETVWDPPWDPSRMTEEARLQLNMF